MATIDQIQSLLTNNNKVIRGEIKEDIDGAKTELLESINLTLMNHQEQLDSLKQKVLELENRESQRTENDLQKEVKERRHNIILKNFDENQESQEELHAKTVDLLTGITEITINDVDYMYRLGKKRNDNSPRPLVIRFLCLHKKENIMKNWKFFAAKKIDVFEDFPAEIRERRKELIPMVKALKQRGIRATIRVDKLLINGEHWSLARAQEFVDEPPQGMSNVEEMQSTQKPLPANNKRSRSSPTDPSTTPNAQRVKKNLPNLKLPKLKNKSKNEVFTVPCPLTPTLNAPFVSTPQKNMQYTKIVSED